MAGTAAGNSIGNLGVANMALANQMNALTAVGAGMGSGGGGALPPLVVNGFAGGAGGGGGKAANILC